MSVRNSETELRVLAVVTLVGSALVFLMVGLKGELPPVFGLENLFVLVVGLEVLAAGVLVRRVHRPER